MTTPISLIQAAEWYGGLPHQNSALENLQQSMRGIPNLEWKFARKWRNNDNGSSISLVNVFNYYGGASHQKEALQFLEDELPLGKLESFAKIWRTAPPPQNAVNLSLPWFPQTDSTTGHANRMCFSSSNSMCAHWVSAKFRSRFTGPNADDQYLKFLLANHGDTTDPGAQVRAMRAIGVKVEWRTNLTVQECINLVRQGNPVSIGFLHRGAWNSPQGGGHYAAMRGFNLDQNVIICNDPWGSFLDNYQGAVENGRNVHYPRYQMIGRFSPENVNSDIPTGWGMIFYPD